MIVNHIQTGIYGGSFNPIHLGHTALGEWLVHEGYLDELWFLVSPQNPLKPASGLLEDQARLHLARLAVDEQPQPTPVQSAISPAAPQFCMLPCHGNSPFRVSDFEFRLPRPSYMVHTLAALRETFPDRDFVLVIGADNWQRFPQWYHSEEILRHHRLIIYPRPGYPVDPSSLPSGITLVDSPLLDISSTQIRHAIASNPAYDGDGLSPRVWREIQARGYYRIK